MTPDADTERQLEDWLEDSARPMPQHVLESALEAVARTTQVSRRPPFGLTWLNQRIAMAAVAAGVVILAVIAAPTVLRGLDGLFGPQPGGGPDASLGPARRWNAAAEFRESPDQMNPSPDSFGNPDVWSYMRSANAVHDPTTYYLFPDFQVPEGGGDQWYERDLINLFVALAPDDTALSIHAWSSGAGVDQRRSAILAWRSPVSGEVRIAGFVSMDVASCGPESADGIAFFIDKADQTLETIRLELGQGSSFGVSTTVPAGESLYFIVDPQSDARCDTTRLSVSITHE